jgi:hypothetical protein
VLSFCIHRFVRRSGFIGFESSRCFTSYALGGLACLLDWGRPAASLRAQGIRRATVNTFGYIAKAIGPQDVLTTLLNNLRVQAMQCPLWPMPCPPSGPAWDSDRLIYSRYAMFPTAPHSTAPNVFGSSRCCRSARTACARPSRSASSPRRVRPSPCAFLTNLSTTYGLPLPPRRAASASGLPGYTLVWVRRCYSLRRDDQYRQARYAITLTTIVQQPLPRLPVPLTAITSTLTGLSLQYHRRNALPGHPGPHERVSRPRAQRAGSRTLR